MELLMQVKGCCNDREEEEEEEEEEEVEAELAKEESSSSSKQQQHQYHPLLLSSANRQHQNSWLGLHDHHSPDATTATDSPNSSSGLGLASSNFPNTHAKIDLMDLSLAPGIGNRSKDISELELLEDEEGNNNTNFHGGGGSSSNQNDNNKIIEKEHMFDKVVTPSDVGKLNRLVIPKQHAEKYFPLDSSSNEKGLLLNFEDRNGKLWRFRYSYWNSSQSYVMTKGWSRFVKEKKLDAGDIVSFQRGAAESYRHRLYIDWRRRPDHHHHHAPGVSDPSFVTPFLFHPNHPNQLSQYSIRWSNRLYSLPSPPPPRPPQLNYSNMFPFQQERNQPWNQHQVHYNVINSGSGSMYPNLIGQREQQNVPMIIDSVPVDHYHHLQQQHHHQHGKSSGSGCTNATAGKRLRLFGVNMECASSSSSSSSAEEARWCNVTAMGNNSSIPPPPLQYLRMPHEDPISLSSSSSSTVPAAAARFQNHQKVGTTSMLFDLDPSLQYRQ